MGFIAGRWLGGGWAVEQQQRRRGNNVTWDISFNTAMSTNYRGIPVYHSGNTSTNGRADYNDGSYVFLTNDPHP